MGMSPLARLALRAPVPVFAAIGPGRQADVERLLARRGLRRALTPRDAAVLLLAGDLPPDAMEPLGRVHDQVPRPRRILRWTDRTETGDAVADRLATAWRGLCGGEDGDDDLQPDAPSNAWRGVGPHGQGGTGMMGGTPYGRPMAMTGLDIRDGLQLDRYTARLGPFAPMLPPGLVLELTLQGDVICDAGVVCPPFAQPADADAPVLCSARMLALLGLEDAARRVIRGGRPGALWLRGAVPRGLGRIEGGGDARERLAGYLAGTPAALAVPPLPELLSGLEWAEAMLVLASLPPSSILRATRLREAA